MLKRTKFIDNSQKFKAMTGKAMDLALANMAKDLKQIAWIRIPFKSGNLQKNTTAEKTAFLKHKVLADTKYAAYQEKGKRKDGSRVVRRYTTAGTGKNYLRDAGKTVTKDSINYMRQANKILGYK